MVLITVLKKADEIGKALGIKNIRVGQTIQILDPALLPVARQYENKHPGSLEFAIESDALFDKKSKHPDKNKMLSKRSVSKYISK
jgi:hypothetical protein